MKTILLLCILMLIITSCSMHNNNVEVIGDENQFVINVPRDDISKYEFIEDVKYVFLDNKFMIGNISRIIFSDNKIFIHDNIADCVIAYSLEGDYLFQIKAKGKGPLEYMRICDFTVNENDKEILILDDRSHKILKYSIQNRKFTNEQKIEFFPTAFAWSNNSLYFFNPYTYNYPRDKSYHYSLLVTTENYKEIKGYFKIDEEIGNFMSNPNPLGFYVGDYLLFQNRFENDIYSMTSDGVRLKYKITFEDNENFKEALEDAISKGTRDTELYNKCATDLNDFCESKEYASFTYWRNNIRFFTVFSKKDGEIIYHGANPTIFSEANIKNDIPIFVVPSRSHSNSFIAIISPNLIFDLLNNIQFRDLLTERLPNKKLAEKIMSIDINSNPVLCIYNFKND